MDADSAVQGLIGALKDTDERVRQQAAWALGAIGAKTAAEPLAQALKDSDSRVRHQAAWALGAIGAKAAAPALAQALKDSDARVRHQAAWALGAIGDRTPCRRWSTRYAMPTRACANRRPGRSAPSATLARRRAWSPH